MSDTNPLVLNPLTVNPEVTKAVGDARNLADIRAAVIAEAEKQTDVANQTAAEQAVAEAERLKTVAAVEAKQFTCTEVIGGREFEFSADNEVELKNMVINALKVAYAVHPEEAPAAPVAPAVDPAVAEVEAQRKADEKAAARADLDVKFRTGVIPVDEYLEQTGALDNYLAKKGISTDSLKAAVDRNDATAYEQSWADATEAFKQSPEGADWPGGDKNVGLMGMQLIAMGLVDAENKVEALAQAYRAMKAKDMLYANDTPAAPAAPAVGAPTTSAAPVAPAAPAASAAPVAAPRIPSQSSSLFGQSFGVSGPTALATSAGKTIDVPKDATPQEIIEHWKAAQLAEGKNPNDAFKQTFAARRA